VPTIDELLQMKTSFSVGSALTPLLSKKDEQWVHKVTCETTRTRINDNQDSRSALGWSNGHTNHLKSQWMD
jgi:hypothetical protein